eukprot:SAG25_NODE_539_length_7086_cov_2.350937_7_plen_62_part_00
MQPSLFTYFGNYEPIVQWYCNSSACAVCPAGPQWQQWFGGDSKIPNFNYFTLGAQPLEQPW